MSKVRVIGLDGGTFTVIDHLAAKGRLPNLAGMMDRGSRATLLSTAPPLTWPAWASFYTGTNPGKTGAADLFKFVPGTYRLEPMNAGNLRGEPIWSLASRHGKRVCIYNVPVTYPAIKVNGVLISGLDAPAFNDQAIYPLEFKEKLLEAVPDFKINFENDAKYLVNHHKDPVGEWIRQAKAYLDMELRTIDYLMQLEDWDLFVAVLRSTDVFQHTLWRDAEKMIAGEAETAEDQMRAGALFECYEEIDRKLESWSSGWDENGSLVVMSDHGFGRLRGHVCVNRVLADAGLLEFLPKEPRRNSRNVLLNRVKTRLPAGAKKKLKRILRKDSEQWTSYVDVLVADIDWSRTKVCSIGGFGCLFLNMKGRDPLGTVSEEERQAVLDEVQAALGRLRDPDDGLPLVTRFYRKEELYSGPLLSEVPDMVINMRDWSYCPVIGTASELSEDSIIRPPTQEWKQLAHTGSHRREGILLMRGSGIAAADLGTAEMVDVAPTIMSLMGLPLLDGWDGQVLKDALPDAVAQQIEKSGEPELRAKAPGGAYTEEDEEEVRRRLENLGYL